MKNLKLVLPLGICCLFTTVNCAKVAKSLDLVPGDQSMQVRGEKGAKGLEAGEFWMAIVGDSSTTGAAADESFVASWSKLTEKFTGVTLQKDMDSVETKLNLSKYPSPQEFGVTEPLMRLTRVLYSTTEYHEAEKGSGVVDKNLEAKMSMAVDTPEYAFGYMVGRALQVYPPHIVLTGQDGKQFDTLSDQFERILDYGAKTLPPLILVSYVANDFCHPDFFDHPVDYFREAYQKRVSEQMAKLSKYPADPNGTKIVFLAPLDVANILTNHDLLQQKVEFQGAGQVTCEAIRKGQVPSNPLSDKMRQTLIGECRGVLSNTDQPQERIQRVKDLQSVQLDVLDASIRDFNTHPAPGITATLASSTREIDFQAGDLANDCFHPGVAGHTRIARQLLSHELKDLKK